MASGKELHRGAEVVGAVEAAVRLMCVPAVVVEDVDGAFEVGDGAGDFEDAVVGPGAHVHAVHGVAKMLFGNFCRRFVWIFEAVLFDF